MPETLEIEFDLLSCRARELDFYVGRHKAYDPLRPGGDLYLMPRRHDREHVETILKYQTSEQLWEYISNAQQN